MRYTHSVVEIHLRMGRQLFTRFVLDLHFTVFKRSINNTASGKQIRKRLTNFCDSLMASETSNVVSPLQHSVKDTHNI